jgi:hypothetical protein
MPKYIKRLDANVSSMAVSSDFLYSTVRLKMKPLSEGPDQLIESAGQRER